MELELSAHAASQLGKWGLVEDDVREVVAAADGSTHWVRDEADEVAVLARKRVGKANVYAGFTPAGGRVLVSTVYAHRLDIKSDEPGVSPDTSGDGAFPDSGWTCSACGAAVKEVPQVDLVYLGTELGGIDGLRCPECGYEMIPEDVVEERMYMSEQMLEAK